MTWNVESNCCLPGAGCWWVWPYIYEMGRENWDTVPWYASTGAGQWAVTREVQPLIVLHTWYRYSGIYTYFIVGTSESSWDPLRVVWYHPFMNGMPRQKYPCTKYEYTDCTRYLVLFTGVHSYQDLILCTKMMVYMGFLCSSWVLITMICSPVNIRILQY